MDNMGVGWVGVGCPRIWLGMVWLRVHIYGAGPGDNHCYRLKTHLVLGLIHQHQKAPSSERQSGVEIDCSNYHPHLGYHVLIDSGLLQTM